MTSEQRAVNSEIPQFLNSTALPLLPVHCFPPLGADVICISKGVCGYRQLKMGETGGLFRTGSRTLLEYIIRRGVLECIQYPFSYSPDRSLCLYYVTSSSGWLPTFHVNECHFGWTDPSNSMPGSEDKCSHTPSKKKSLQDYSKTPQITFSLSTGTFLPSKLQTAK